MAIPVESYLGDAIGNMLCQTADTIHVKEENSAGNELSSKLVGPLCERLVLAHTVGSYVSKGALFSMSFRGRSSSCRISDLIKVASTKDLK